MPASADETLSPASSASIAAIRFAIGFICILAYRTLAISPPPKAENRMRELFDEVAGKSPLDPQEAVRRATRTPPRKRFYTSAGVAETGGGDAWRAFHARGGYRACAPAGDGNRLRARGIP